MPLTSAAIELLRTLPPDSGDDNPGLGSETTFVEEEPSAVEVEVGLSFCFLSFGPVAEVVAPSKIKVTSCERLAGAWDEEDVRTLVGIMPLGCCLRVVVEDALVDVTTVDEVVVLTPFVEDATVVDGCVVALYFGGIVAETSELEEMSNCPLKSDGDAEEDVVVLG